MADQIYKHLNPEAKKRWNKAVNTTKYYANKAWNYAQDKAMSTFDTLTSKALTDWMQTHVWNYVIPMIPTAALALYNRFAGNRIVENYPSQFDFDTTIT